MIEQEEAKRVREDILKVTQHGKKLSELGGSLALLLPKTWARLYAWKLDGCYWVRIIQEGENIIITPLDKEEALKLMEVNDVSPGETSGSN